MSQALAPLRDLTRRLQTLALDREYAAIAALQDELKARVEQAMSAKSDTNEELRGLLQTLESLFAGLASEIASDQQNAGNDLKHTRSQFKAARSYLDNARHQS